MKTMHEDVYARLAKHLSSLGMGYPPKEELLEILKSTFTFREAEVALLLPTEVIPFQPVSAAKLASDTGIPVAELETVLSDLVNRGLLYSGKTEEGKTGFALQQFGYGFPQAFLWGGVDQPDAKRMAELVAKYGRKDELYEVYGTTPTKAFRYLPNTVHIEPETHAVFPFEMMENVIKNARIIALVSCACRVTAQLIGKKRCEHPLEVCMKFDELAEYVIERGLGREVNKTEALEVIKRCEEAGLVHLVDNAREGIKHTCNCCSCCCWSVGTIKRRKIPRDVLMATYFLRETDTDKCTGCGSCVDICPVNAIRMEDDLPVIDMEWCIGCGVCGLPCPVSAVRLVRKTDVLPPKDFRELHTQILKERKR
jgi:formate hydrogenlyase subunit 6/NADH:ubiquinone oxidoreductase subunit I